jgi:hypothetical protein
MFMAHCLINLPFLIIREFKLPARKGGYIARAPDVANLRRGSWQQSVVLEPTSAADLGGRNGIENIYKKGRKRKGK